MEGLLHPRAISASLTSAKDTTRVARVPLTALNRKETGKNWFGKDRLGYEERWLSGWSVGLGLFGKIGGAVVRVLRSSDYKWISSFRD
jgi:hypothetical protein